MLTTRLNIRRAARMIRRGGFTLVELLVVIGIIAILAGVALGPITNGIKKAKQSAGVQTSHAIGLAMYSAANDNSQAYPDSTGNNAADVAKTLLAGGYVSDASIFFISGDQGASKYTGSTAATDIQNTNVSWDFLGNAGNGASSSNYTFLPLMWSTLGGSGSTPPTASTFNTANQAITGSMTSATQSPFVTDGIVVFYVNNSAAFLKSSLAGTTYTVTLLTSASNTGGPTAYSINSGK